MGKIYKLSDDEAELIEIIRNLRSAFPNGYKEQLWLAEEAFNKLIDLP
jgi:hypothetical protein